MMYRLVEGMPAPRQRSSVTCGPACLTVARMLVDPVFARWMVDGQGAPVDAPDAATYPERFAAYERIVHRRTNALHTGSDALNLPWPRSLGTPPWGARKELEFGASTKGTSYRVVPLRAIGGSRSKARQGLDQHFARLLEVIGPGAPAILYIGNTLAPRHVCLLMPGTSQTTLSLYDPHAGEVLALDGSRFAGSRLKVAGWNHPWVTVEPSTHRRVELRSPHKVEALRLPSPLVPTLSRDAEV